MNVSDLPQDLPVGMHPIWKMVCGGKPTGPRKGGQGEEEGGGVPKEPAGKQTARKAGRNSEVNQAMQVGTQQFSEVAQSLLTKMGEEDPSLANITKQMEASNKLTQARDNLLINKESLVSCKEILEQLLPDGSHSEYTAEQVAQVRVRHASLKLQLAMGT